MAIQQHSKAKRAAQKIINIQVLKFSTVLETWNKKRATEEIEDEE